MPHEHDGGNRPELITLWVVVPVAVHAAAERLAIAYERARGNYKIMAEELKLDPTNLHRLLKRFHIPDPLWRPHPDSAPPMLS